MLHTEPLSSLELDSEQDERARRLHAEAVVFDGSSVVMKEPAHFERAFAGGVTATNHTVTNPHSTLEEAFTDMASCARWIAENSGKGLLATTVADIREAKESGREAIVFGPQNSEFIGTDLDNLYVAYALGMRIMQLTYQRQNWVGSGCGEVEDSGISMFGRALIAEMDQIGVVVDLSHCGTKTSLQGMELSKNPAIFTHAHPAALNPHIRHKSDDVLKALADQGGVIGITALSAFNADPEEPRVRQGLPAFAKNISYVAELVGVDHVGIGLDFDETNTPEKYAADKARHPELDLAFGWDDKRIFDLVDSSQEMNVTRALVDAGFSDEEIMKILGGNFLRVLEQVWGS
jgi:membrane dipeptidase